MILELAELTGADAAVSKLINDRIADKSRTDTINVNSELYHAEVVKAITALKSRPSLTPLTDPTVRGVLVECSPDDDDSIWFEVRPDGIPDGVLKLRPASEFGVPADPAQKLVPLEPGMIVGRKLHDLLTLGANVIRYKGDAYEPVDPTLYGVDAGRVRELEGIREMEEDRVVPSFTVQEAGRTWHYEQLCFDDNELHSLEELARGYGNTTWPDAILKAASDLERLRKAIKEVVNLPLLPLQCRKTLQAALTPPTAASGEPAMECLDKIGEAMTASAPTAEGGGDGD